MRTPSFVHSTVLIIARHLTGSHKDAQTSSSHKKSQKAHKNKLVVLCSLLAPKNHEQSTKDQVICLMCFLCLFVAKCLFNTRAKVSGHVVPQFTQQIDSPGSYN